jgi:hypothetical protein
MPRAAACHTTLVLSLSSIWSRDIKPPTEQDQSHSFSDDFENEGSAINLGPPKRSILCGGAIDLVAGMGFET